MRPERKRLVLGLLVILLFSAYVSIISRLQDGLTAPFFWLWMAFGEFIPESESPWAALICAGLLAVCLLAASRTKVGIIALVLWLVINYLPAIFFLSSYDGHS